VSEVAAKSLHAVNATRLSQRVADAAAIAGRLAHDFDNLLMGVLGFAELALAQTTEGSPAHAYMTELYKVAQRGTTITGQMHDLSRGGRFTPAPNSVPDACRTAIAAMAEADVTGIEFGTEFADGLPRVMLSSESLGLVLRQVMANAVEACSGRGVVAILARLSVLHETDYEFLPRPLAAGKYAAVAVTDTGPGISAELLARITAAPLVTTKVRHRGLGLATVYRVLDAHGGGVRFDPAEPHGTRVTLMLPAAPAERPASLPPSGRTASTVASR